MRKNAQIGQTMTWMVGFVVVFFALTIFMITIVILSGQKTLFEGKDSIDFVSSNADINSQNVLIGILNDRMENKMIVKNFIKEGINDPSSVRGPLEEFVDNKLGNLGSCDYSFLIEYDPENLEDYRSGKSELLYRKVSFGSIEFLSGGLGSELNLFSGEVRIRIKFYLGECK